MSEEYNFHYFDIHGHGEPIRMMLSLAGANWKDLRVEKSEWPVVKTNFPGEALPCLELKDGTRLTQSHAIANYVGRAFGYLPTDSMKAYQSDAIVQILKDRMPGIVFCPFSDDIKEEDRPAAVDKSIGEEFPRLMRSLEPWLKSDGFLLGEELSVADFFIGNFYWSVCANEKFGYGVKDGRWADALKKYPKFVAYAQRFYEANKKYMDTRRVCGI